jgi:hypothetical protein
MWTNPRSQVAVTTIFFTVVPNVCEYLVWNLLSVNPSGAQNFEVTAIFLENLYTPGLGYYFLDKHITVLRKCSASIFMLEGLLLWNDSLKTVSRSVECISNKNFDILTHCSWPSASHSFPRSGKDNLHLSLPYVVWICGSLEKSEKTFFFNFLVYSIVERRSQWPHGLRRMSTAARLLWSWVRISLGAWMFICCVVCCQVEVSATSWSLVQRSHTDCGASLCVIKKPRGLGGHSRR